MPIRLSVVSADGADPRSIEFDTPSIRIGREADCDLRLPFPAVSGYHCTIFSEDGQRYLIRDDGSTNGTRFNGKLLATQTPETLTANACVKVGGVRIDINTNPLEDNALPVAHTGTLVRMMLSETVSDASAERACITVVRGPKKGESIFLPDEFDSITISDEPTALFYIPKLAVPLRIRPEDDGFAITTLDDLDAPGASRHRVTVNGEPLEGSYHLASEDRIEVGRCVLRFFDPLEAMLVELDAQSSTARSPEEPADLKGTTMANQAVEDNASLLAPPPEPERDAPEARGLARSWGLIEMLLIAFSAMMIASVGYLFYLMLR